MKHTKETEEKIKQYMLDCIWSDDEELPTPEAKLIYAYNRFKSEAGHNILRMGTNAAFADWLQGLPLGYDFYNSDILRLAEEWGQPTETESQQYKILSSWWSFLTHNFFKLCKKYKIFVEV